MVWVHNINPVLLSLGPLEIRYYGLAYVFGFILTYFILKHLIKRKEFDMSNEELEEALLYGAIGLLLGARIGYFLFYNFTHILQNPLQLLMIWQGGMSFHGGLIGTIIGGYIFCKRHNKDAYMIADLAVIPSALALAVGRIANFINAELYGRATQVAWAVDFGDGVARHPSQLYESAKNVFMFAVLWVVKDKDYKKGTLFWLFIGMYGYLRFTIEFVREPDVQLGFVLFNFFTMGQVLTAIMALTATSVLIYWYVIKK